MGDAVSDSRSGCSILIARSQLVRFVTSTPLNPILLRFDPVVTPQQRITVHGTSKSISSSGASTASRLTFTPMNHIPSGWLSSFTVPSRMWTLVFDVLLCPATRNASVSSYHFLSTNTTAVFVGVGMSTAILFEGGR